MTRSGSGWIFASALTVFALTAFGPGEARAGYNVYLALTTHSGNEYTYTYDVSITANQEQISAGNFFRIFDFAGYIAGSATGPAGWVVTSALTNPVPPPNVILQHGDDPSIPNITFTYQGSTPVSGPASIGSFSIESIYSVAETLKDFAGQSTNTSTGTLIDTRLDVYVPVPEPTSVVSAGIGFILFGIGYAARYRRKHAA